MLRQQWKISSWFEKTESGLRYQFIQRGEGKASCSWKTVSVHYEGSLESGKFLIALIQENQLNSIRTGNVY
jgi:FKBP-type peptidyl-prolyl cis-trans isomerase